MNLFVFGLGYSALHLVKRYRERFGRVAGTVTGADKAAKLAADGIAATVLDATAGASLPEAVQAELRQAEALLVSVPPPADATVASLLRGRRDLMPSLTTIGYFSTVGVYGDRAGGVVDFTTPVAPTGERGRERVAAEERWRALAATVGARCLIFRIAGIYGPGRNALLDVAAGRARRIVKPGQVFNRIHVDDIAGLVMAALERPDADAIYDLADDEPAPPQDVVSHAADLLGVARPPEVAFEAATISPMARSFWDECKRVDNARTKAALDYAFVHPTFREGLAALLVAGEGRARQSD
jgi:nucleoside-diphosphate-sugar epimerase